MTIAIVRSALTATTLVVTAVGGAYVASSLVGSAARPVPPAAPIPVAAPAVPGPAAGALGSVGTRNRPVRPAKAQARHTPKATPVPVAPRTEVRAAAASQADVTTARPSTSSGGTGQRPSSHDDHSDDPGQQPGDDGTGRDD
ncbi:MAG: hypothetical protein JWR52_1702 [Marmoricola sp.]|nr:hypothetical protein [Marmoricola sp.]